MNEFVVYQLLCDLVLGGGKAESTGVLSLGNFNAPSPRGSHEGTVREIRGQQVIFSLLAIPRWEGRMKAAGSIPQGVGIR